MIEPISFASQTLTLAFSTTPDEGVFSEPLSGSRQVFIVNASGKVSGEISGEISQQVTEVHRVPAPNHQGIAISFQVTSGLGSIKGYYTGSITMAEEKTHWQVHGRGQLLSVSGAYAELFLAEVFISSQVPIVDGRAAGENGTMTIAPQAITGFLAS